MSLPLEIDWSKTDYWENFVPSLSRIVRLYLGAELEEEKTQQITGFFHEGSKRLAFDHTDHRPTNQRVEAFTKKTLEQGFPAGLMISWLNSRFGVRLFQKEDGHYVPIVSWGRKQVSAIASLNRAKLEDILPYEEYRFKEMSSNYGDGSASWSDIIFFVALGNQIGTRLCVDPVDVRLQLNEDVDKCLAAAANHCTMSQKVTPDGWYHFFSTSSSQTAVDFGILAQEKLQILAAKPRYEKDQLKVVMGLNLVQSCRIGPGGPYDDDSIIAFELINRFRKYNLRATDKTVANITDQSRSDWIEFDTYSHDNGRRFKICGHNKWP